MQIFWLLGAAQLRRLLHALALFERADGERWLEQR